MGMLPQKGAVSVGRELVVYKKSRVKLLDLGLSEGKDAVGLDKHLHLRVSLLSSRFTAP